MIPKMPDLDPAYGTPASRFGGLVRVQNKRREFLWVDEQFVSEY